MNKCICIQYKGLLQIVAFTPMYSIWPFNRFNIYLVIIVLYNDPYQ